MNVKWFMEKSQLGAQEASALKNGCDDWPPLAVYCYTTGITHGLGIGLLLVAIIVSMLWIL
jgi:hypothetical protein